MKIQTLNRRTLFLFAGLLSAIMVSVFAFAHVRSDHDAQADQNICGDAEVSSIDGSVTGSTTDCVVPLPLLTPPQVAALFIGFYVDKHTHADHAASTENEEFQTETMGYLGVDYAAAQSRLEDFSTEGPYRLVDTDDFSTRYIETIPEDAFGTSFEAMIAAVRGFLQAGEKNCPSCKTLSIPSPASYLPNDNWSSADRVHFALGLETPSPDVPGALRSGLGAFTFDGNGTLTAYAFQEYNFSSYGTEDLIADLSLMSEGLRD